VTTINYSAIANLHNSQITTAPAKPFPACCLFTSLSLATTSNSGDSAASRTQALPSPTPVQSCLLFSQLNWITISSQPAVFSRAVPWQRLLTVEILQLPALPTPVQRCLLFPQLNCITISSQPPLMSCTAHGTQLTILIAPVVTLKTMLNGQNRKHRFIVACVFVAAGTCKTQKLYLFLNVIMQVWRNCQVLSEQTDLCCCSLITISLTVLRCSQYSCNWEHHFSYSDPDSPTSGLNVTG
jgi:hypothetical protein